MTAPKVAVTIVNHAAIDIAVAPDVLWRAIVDEYVAAEKFRDQYKITPLDGPSAPFGGYRMVMEKDGAVVDERIVDFTERDDQARRLSLFADYLSIPGGMQVYATYQAHETPAGSRYTLDCHTRLSVDSLTGVREEVTATVTKMRDQFEQALDQFLSSVKAKLETR